VLTYSGVKLAETIALALAGWYLMMPPNACDLSSACNRSSVVWNMVSELRSRSPHNVYSEAAWRNRLNQQLVADAPLNEWHQLDEFETLLECRGERNENMRNFPTTEQQAIGALVQWELNDEGDPHPSADKVRKRADQENFSRRTQVEAEKCVASDDPRLK
jgi:hypothetical protein